MRFSRKNRMKKILFVATLALFGAAQAQAEQYRVVGVSDGDTVKVLSSDRQQMKCRLFAIDSPESNQDYGQRAKQSLSDLVFNKTVDVQVVDRDQYGRSVCRIFINGLDVNKAQLERGFAWHYKRYDSNPEYSQAESAAKRQRLGLWADANPTPPWAFRRSERSSKF